MLIALKGIGRWTADIYLLSALRRPDIWPTGDLALATAVQEVKRLRRRPSPEHLEKLSQPWRPYRAVDSASPGALTAPSPLASSGMLTFPSAASALRKFLSSRVLLRYA